MTKKIARVFVGMPVYNGERFLRQAFDSLIAQEISDWELFISDDTSTDSTESICKEYAYKDSRIKYFRQQKNIGMFANFKFVLDRADGKYFMWMAQDDIRDKGYLLICTNKLDSDQNLGLATTVTAIIDSYGRTIIEENDLLKFNCISKFINVTKYILQPEILGKCNLMYGLFRTDVVRSTWNAYPQRKVWGQDYMFSLALISRFQIYIDQRPLFKKRLGGYSSPDALIGDDKNVIKIIKYKNPKNHMFPFLRFKPYFMGHMEALSGTPYRFWGALILFIRLPRSFFIYLKERDVKKFLKGIINRQI